MYVHPACRLPMLNAVKIPDGIDDAGVRSQLLNEFGIEIGAGLGPMKGKTWRIGLMGFIPFGAILGILLFIVLFMLKSFWLGLRLFGVLIAVDQVIENVLPPRLLGKLTD